MRHFEFPPDVLTAIEHDRFHHADPHVQRRMEALWLNPHEIVVVTVYTYYFCLLSRICGSVPARADGQAGDIRPLPWPQTCGSRTLF